MGTRTGEVITREALYELVWEKPLSTLGPELGYSDVGLSKVCKKMRIPRPGRGYWAKKAAGKRLRRIPLEPLRDQDRETPRQLEPPPTSEPQPLPEPVALQVAHEALAENKIVVQSALRRPHPLVRTTLAALGRSTGSRGDGYLGNWKTRYLDVDVSKPLLKRALRIMDAVLKAFEARGWHVSLGKDGRNSYVEILGQRIPFGIREPRRQVRATEDDDDGRRNRRREEPSGTLALVLRESWGRSVKKTVGESERRPLEERLNDFMVAAVKLAHQRAEWERRRRALEERCRAQESARLEAKRRREIEARRIGVLEAQAERLHQSRRILELMAAVRSAAGARGAEVDRARLERWCEWAEARSQALDPLEEIFADSAGPAGPDSPQKSSS